MQKFPLSELISVAGMRPEEWRTWEKIPWNDHSFSERMLIEHLDQQHNLASRKQEWIDLACRYIHETVLNHRPSRILDLGCGPGLYASPLQKMGHQVSGIDYAPAAIRYAQERCPEAEFRLGDILSIDYGTGFDLVLVLFGELGPFSPSERKVVLEKSAAAILPGGQLLVELHRPEPLREASQRGSNWSSSAGGLFSPEPHLILSESNWWEAEMAAAFRSVVVTANEVLVFREAVSARPLELWIDELQSVGWSHVSIGPDIGPGNEFVTVLSRA